MTPRKGESRKDFLNRANKYKVKWRETQRTLAADGTVKSVTEKRVGRSPKKVVKIAAPIISRTSTLYDAEGRVSAQWVQEKPEEKARVDRLHAMAQALAKKLPRSEPVAPPSPPIAEELLVGYPIGDHHMGMLAWKHETGANYDLDIGERLLTDAFYHLSLTTPAAGMALVAVLGDFFHYDSMEAVTPTSRNLLDADGRYPEMFMAAVRTVRNCIDTALRRHNQVRVIIEIGNHDLSTSVDLAILLLNVYENEPRVSVDISPKHYHYFHWGSTLIGTHHGHGAKLEQLPLIMATDQPEAWAASKYRTWWTGHVHSKRAFDYPGCTVESFRILPPADAWAANKGYRSHRSMEAIVYHRQHGEVARHTVNPQMLESK